MNYASKRIDSQLRAMLISETHWGNRTSWISPSPGLEPANPSAMQNGSAELGSLPKTDGKSEMEHGQEGAIHHPDFSRTQRDWHGLEDVGRARDRDPHRWPSCSLSYNRPALDGRYLSVAGKLTHKIYDNLRPTATYERVLVQYEVYPSLLQHHAGNNSTAKVSKGRCLASNLRECWSRALK